MTTDTDDWQALAAELSAEGGLPDKRARVIALVATGHTHAETAEILDLSSRSEVSTHVARYREADLPEAQWLTENAPDV